MKYAARATLLAVASLAVLPAQRVAAGEDIRYTYQEVSVKHVSIVTSKKYSEVNQFIESKLRHVDMAMRELLKNDQADQFRAAAQHVVENYGLSIHNIAYNGKVQILNGSESNLIVYYIGDFITAAKLNLAAPGSALYVPLRTAVYENGDGGTTIEYDEPSSVLAQFHTSVTDTLGKDLDARLGKFIGDAAR